MIRNDEKLTDDPVLQGDDMTDVNDGEADVETLEEYGPVDDDEDFADPPGVDEPPEVESQNQPPEESS